MSDYIYLAVFVLLLASCLVWPYRPKKMELLKYTCYGRGDYLLTVLMPSGREQQYRGSPTVFHHYPSGKRCGTYMESWLSDRVTAIRWREGS